MPIVDPEKLELDADEEVVDVNTHQPTDSLEEEAHEFELPEKFKGKNLKDVYHAYEQSEKEKSRLGNEIGELRKLSDQLLQIQLSEKQKKEVQQQPQLTDVDFFADPQNAVNAAIQNHPVVNQLKQAEMQLKQQSALAEMKNKHPDFIDVAQDPDFQQWVGNSKVRQRLFMEANAYDVDSADELFSTWKERKQLRTTADAEAKEKAKRDTDLKAARTTSGSAADSASKKTFRRADLIRLQIENPSRYLELLPEIRQAYSEGRVK